MNSTLRNILAVLAGIVVGGAVNMGIITISGSIIPPPPGADMTTPEGITAAMSLLEPKHFLMPFLAHALGTFVGAYIASLIAVSNKMRFAMAIGVFTLIGGISAVYMIPAPIWFDACDLLLAYIPTAYLAGKLNGG
ncbi:MAG: hypothetical protein ACOYOA_06790 [Saprospiraceae bacterium]